MVISMRSRSFLYSTTVVIALAAVILAGCSNAKSAASGGASSAVARFKSLPVNSTTGYPEYNKKVTLTWWSWNITAQPEVAIFEKYYPSVTIKRPAEGAGTTLYNKLSTAIQANSGLPDLSMIEYDVVSEFAQTGALANIAPYVDQYKKDYPQWVWNQVSQNGKVFGMPSDIGPMGLWYRDPALKRNHLSVPTTWAQFAQEAVAYHKANPGKYFTYFAENDGQWMTSLLWQAGISPFHKTSSGWKVDLNSPQIAKVFQYWVNLIKAGAVQPAQTFTPAWEKSLNDGQYAVGVGSAWYINQMLVPWVKNLASKGWRAGLIPAWKAGDTTDGDWGGSSQVVLKATKHIVASAIFDAFINTSKQELTVYGGVRSNGANGPFPGSNVAYSLPSFDSANPMLGGQRIFKDIFAVEAPRIYPDFQWSPWSSYVFNLMQTEISKVIQGTETLQTALNNVQQQTVSYAQSQGVKVST